MTVTAQTTHAPHPRPRTPAALALSFAALATLAAPAGATPPETGPVPGPANPVVGPARAHGRTLTPGLFQMSGTYLKVGDTRPYPPEVSDPSPPFVNARGEVEIYGSARFFIRYPNWAEFSHGANYEILPLDVRYPNQNAMAGDYGQPWDVRKFRVQNGDGSHEFLVGGTMTPSHGRPVAEWPEDNPGRRIFAFHPEAAGDWLRDLLPLAGSLATGWAEHSYGGNFIQEGNDDPTLLRVGVPGAGKIYFFYERVTEVHGEVPFRTEIFARETADPEAPTAQPEIPILTVGDHPFPSTARSNGGFLMEGPRPAHVRVGDRWFYILGFSSGDFCTNSYGINYAWATSIAGPYHPALTADGRDLLDLGREIKARFDLSWVGRPAFFATPDGHYEMMFHGAEKRILPDNDYSVWPGSKGSKYELWQFFRSIFKTRIDLQLGPDGSPQISLALDTADNAE